MSAALQYYSIAAPHYGTAKELPVTFLISTPDKYNFNFICKFDIGKNEMSYTN
jgi:hypothetical protein